MSKIYSIILENGKKLSVGDKIPFRILNVEGSNERNIECTIKGFDWFDDDSDIYALFEEPMLYYWNQKLGCDRWKNVYPTIYQRLLKYSLTNDDANTLNSFVRNFNVGEWNRRNVKYINVENLEITK